MTAQEKRIHAYKRLPRGLFHLVTDKVPGDFIFKTKSHYIIGMNTLALASLRFSINIISFVIMGNHIHLLLEATGIACVQTFQFIKYRLSRLLHLREKISDTGFILIPVQDGAQLANTILYIDRNPYETEINILPSGYLWGTGFLAFSQVNEYFWGMPARNFSAREKEKLLHSRDPIPDHWLIHPGLGMILPSNYVDTRTTERIFGSASMYQTRLARAYESFVHIADGIGESITFSSKETDDIIFSLCQKHYGGAKPTELRRWEKEKLILELHNTYRIPAETLSQKVDVPIFIIRQLLSSKKNR